MHKIITYLGFAKKSNSLVIGQSQVNRTNKRMYLILLSATSSENLINLAKNVAKKHGCEYIVANLELSDLTHIQNVKIVGITNENLSKAIIENKEKIIG